jgi:hypothetical protein
MDNLPDDLVCLSRNLLSGIDSLDNLVIRSQTGGGNNRVFILETDGSPKYVMKHYFRHADDPRDRCRAEWTFLEYAMNAGVHCVPKPIKCDPVKGISVFEYIKGQKVSANQLRRDHIIQALDFFEDLNRAKNAPVSRNLLNASESCFSIKDHMDCVNRRIGSLLHIEKESEIDRSAFHFIHDELIPLWERVRTSVLDQESEGTLGIDESLPEKDICISPSDFGFHNALQTDKDAVFFIDFEYAGRDDPVKMICDFFCQPEVPVPHSYLPMFSTRVFKRLDNPQLYCQRLEMLFPVHALKWCCIILNEFLPVGRARRMFANHDINIDEIKHKQLEKARNLYKTVSSMH